MVPFAKQLEMVQVMLEPKTGKVSAREGGGEKGDEKCH
jgi:hypothetical protein